MNGIRQYHRVQVMTADRVRIVVMLYDGILRFNGQAMKCIAEGNIDGRNNSINRSLAIIEELSGALNMEEGGEIARNLARLYDYSIVQLNTANRNNDPRPIEAVTRVIGELKAGWEGLYSNGEKSPSEPSPRALAGNGY